MTEWDALHYSRRCMVGTGSTVGGYALAIAQVVPLWALPLLVVPLSVWVLGQTVTYAMLNHDLHHRHPYIAARSLPAARAAIAHL